MSEEQDLIQQLADRIESNRKEIKEGLEEKKDQFIELVKSFVAGMEPTKAALHTILAILGYQNLPDSWPDLLKIAWGPVGIELAKSPAGESTLGINILGSGIEFPVNSQIAGLTMLTYLGFECLPWENVQDSIYDINKKEKEAFSAYEEALSKYGTVITEEEKEILDDAIARINVAMKGGFIERAKNVILLTSGLIGYVEGMTATWEERLGEGEG